jgi:hypothetical protein
MGQSGRVTPVITWGHFNKCATSSLRKVCEIDERGGHIVED